MERLIYWLAQRPLLFWLLVKAAWVVCGLFSIVIIALSFIVNPWYSVILLILIMTACVSDFTKRVLAKSGQNLLRSDLRAPVIYLRSFSDDEGIFATIAGAAEGFGNFESGELAIARIMQTVGPFVAIGRPGQYIPNIGAARIYVPDNNWQQHVTNLLRRCRLVVVRMGYTEGLFWELTEIVRVCSPQQVVLYNPYQRSRRERVWHAAYSTFREAAIGVFPKRLPKSPRAVEIIGFNATWAVVSRKTNRSLWAFLKRKATGSRVSELLEDLRPILQNACINQPKVTYTDSEASRAVIYGVIRILFLLFSVFLVFPTIWKIAVPGGFKLAAIMTAIMMYLTWALIIGPLREYLSIRHVAGQTGFQRRKRRLRAESTAHLQ